MNAAKTETAGGKSRRSWLFFAFCVAGLTLFFQFGKYSLGLDTFWNVRLLHAGVACLIACFYLRFLHRTFRAKRGSTGDSEKRVPVLSRCLWATLGLAVALLGLAALHNKNLARASTQESITEGQRGARVKLDNEYRWGIPALIGETDFAWNVEGKTERCALSVGIEGKSIKSNDSGNRIIDSNTRAEHWVEHRASSESIERVGLARLYCRFIESR